MVYRMQTSASSVDPSYPSVLRTLCESEDVLIIPDFLAQVEGEELEVLSPTKSGGARGPESLNESDDDGKSDSLRPPQVLIVYERFDDGEKPTAVVCQKFYVEFSLMRAVGRSLPAFPTLGCLKIEDSCIGKELAEGLAGMLAEEPGRQVYHLSLDGNPDIREVLPLFLSLPNGLKVLSLQRCDLDDEGIEMLAQSLTYTDQRQQTLTMLNLGMNRIASRGAQHLADALRTNRTLMALSLEGNHIGDEGAAFIAQVLQKFHLTSPEIELRRRRIFTATLAKANILAKHSQSDRRSKKDEPEPQTSNTNARIQQPSTIKIRGPDGRLCLSTRDKRSKPSQPSLNSAQRLKKGRQAEDPPRQTDNSQSSLLHLDPLLDNHPFVNETFTSEGKIWCHGCWSLLRLNIAYNSLTGRSADIFAEAMLNRSHEFNSGPQHRFKLIILPGNLIKEGSNEAERLQEAMSNLPMQTANLKICDRPT